MWSPAGVQRTPLRACGMRSFVRFVFFGRGLDRRGRRSLQRGACDGGKIRDAELGVRNLNAQTFAYHPCNCRDRRSICGFGHARVLTTHRVVIHYARAASLPRRSKTRLIKTKRTNKRISLTLLIPHFLSHSALQKVFPAWHSLRHIAESVTSAATKRGFDS